MFEERTSSYIGRGNILISKGKIKEAMELFVKGLEHYAGKVLKAIQPYSKADASLIVIVLRHIADEVEKNNEGTKEVVEKLSKIIVFPEVKETERIRKPNRR